MVPDTCTTLKGKPVGEARGMSVHESQSLLMEMQACRSREFVRFAAPVLRQAFNGEGPDWAEENLYRYLTLVEPGFIRVEAGVAAQRSDA